MLIGLPSYTDRLFCSHTFPLVDRHRIVEKMPKAKKGGAPVIDQERDWSGRDFLRMRATLDPFALILSVLPFDPSSSNL